MGLYTLTLREVIYHYTQDLNPLQRIQGLNTRTAITPYRPDNYTPGNGGKYPFYKMENYPSIEERITTAKDHILKTDLPFATTEFRTDFWEAFCVEYLTREIEYESTALFILKLNQNVKNVLPRYNILYNAAKEDLEPFITYRKSTDRGVNEKTNRDTDGSSEQNVNSSSKTVFEDTPQNKLLNTDYATNITSVDAGTGTKNSYTEGEDSNRNLSEDVIEEGFTKPKIELLEELYSKLQDLIHNMVLEVGDPLFLKIFN